MKKPNVKNIFAKQSFKRGGYSVLIAVIVIAAVVLVNIGVSLVDDRFGLSVDMSANKLYSITAQTKKTVSELSEPVKIYALMRQGAEKTYIVEMLDNYRHINPDMVSYEIVDPVKNPSFASQYTDLNLSEDSIIVTNGDGTRARAISNYDMFEMAYSQTTGSTYAKAFKGEQTVTNAIIFVTAESNISAYFLTGHQETELANFSYITQYMESLNLRVESLPGTALDKLQKGDIIIIPSPATDLSEGEYEQLRAFLEDDGYMIFMTDAGRTELPYFEALLELYNVKLNHDMVVEGDANSYYMAPEVIIPKLSLDSHASVAGLAQNNQVAVFPYATSLSRTPLQSDSIKVDTVLASSSAAYGRADVYSTETQKVQGDLDGPLDVGYVIHEVDDQGNDVGTKIMLFGNSSFLTNQNVAGISGNIDLFLGSLKYLMGEVDTVTIVGKSLVDNSLRFTSATQIYVLAGIVVIVVPLLVLIGGLVVWIRRRHL